ncbi:MAG TPA: zinc-ribbon domain-containing protein, partial [Ramlibacter sp.]|nr:zinc-ribbon domain-containing protein [Ramlibacter sp.]
MSLITCCPACQTMFRVVPDQLRISEGWVRCGHCSEVFDAAAHLQDRLPGPAAPPPSRVALEEAPAEDTSPVAVVDAAELAEAASATEIASSSYPPFVLRREDTTDSIFGAALAPAPLPQPLPQPPEAQQPIAVPSRPASVDAQDSLAPDDGAPD